MISAVHRDSEHGQQDQQGIAEAGHQYRRQHVQPARPAGALPQDKSVLRPEGQNKSEGQQVAVQKGGDHHG
jgi:hypothetical protein